MIITPSNVFEDKVRLSSVNVDSFYVARLSYYFGLMQDVPALHTLLRQVSVPELSREEKSWMVLRSHVSISRYASWAEEINTSTWAEKPKGLRCPRWTFARDSKGEELFRAHSLWCVVNTKTHHPEKPDRISEKLGTAAISPLSDEVFPGKPDFRSVEHSLVNPVEKAAALRFSDFDYNGHMNNICYVDLILESFGRDFLSSRLAAETDIIWEREIRPEDNIKVLSGFLSPDESYAAVVRKEPDGSTTTCCEARMVWKDRKQLSRPLSQISSGAV